MDWFSSWFNADYSLVYAHRDAQEAAAQISFLSQLLGDKLKGSCLDVACGGGRHLKELARISKFVVGVDLSPILLRDAQTSAQGAYLVRADMRSLPFASSTFDVCTNLFTGFGYFDSDREHLDMLREWKRVIKPRSFLVIDYMNRENELLNLVAESVREEKGFSILEKRALSPDGRRIEKSILFRDAINGQVSRSYQESVRLYSSDEMIEMLNAAGFEIKYMLGAYSTIPFGQDSKRLLLVASS